MRVAIGQFAASADWQENLRTCRDLVQQARAGGADLLVLPEGVLARFSEDRARIRQAAQPVTGPFITGLLEATAGNNLTVVVEIHEPGPDGRAYNTLVVAGDGKVQQTYRKLHLYDAFESRESDDVMPGSGQPMVFSCAGLTVGLMTCYDVRFPEMARLLADQGAEALLLPAAWVRGPLKEHHCQVMVTARALENTCYVVAAGECGPRNIGLSMVVDPLGVPVGQLADEPGVLWATLDPHRVAQAHARLPVLANRRFRVDDRVLAHDRSPSRPAAETTDQPRRSA